MHSYNGPGRAVAYANNAMCATSHPLAAQTALSILDKGGNAADAAVAGAVVLGFCEPMMTGLGGDMFAIVREPDGSYHGLNGSGRAPSALSAETLRGQGLDSVPLDSAHAVTVPGAVNGFETLLKERGRLDLGTVLAPAIDAAERGVPVCRRSSIDWAQFGHRLQGAGKLHYLSNGAAYRAGELFASPAQAEALRLIARDGAAAFYEGPIRDDILATLRADGGLHTEEDFAATAATAVEPIRASYRGHDLIELPPNGQGVTALLMAKILERFDMAGLNPDGAERVHLLAEATRLSYGARDRFVGDPENSGDRAARLLRDDTAEALAALIDPARATPAIDERAEAVHRDTVYICVVDDEGRAVSLIYSTFWPFGSGLASERYGISLQNRGAGFTLKPGHCNELTGGRRPLHTLIPGFMEKAGEYYMPFGVMGGPYQATGHVHFLTGHVDFRMDIQAAIDAPRSFADPQSGELSLEAGFSDAVVEKLAAMGHATARAPIGMGGAQAIRRDAQTGLLTGATDPRKDGVALGR